MTPNPEEDRGNFLAVLALLLLVTSVLVTLYNVPTQPERACSTERNSQ